MDFFSTHPLPLFGGSFAHAQTPTPTFTEDEIRSYARSVWAMEPLRKQAYSEIRQIAGQNPLPEIACYRKPEIENLPDNIRAIAINYCNQSRQIVITNGLSIARFNAITSSLTNNTDLERRIQAELLKLQTPPGK